MIKRCNYTGRKKITRKHAKISIRENANTSATINADLSLDEYQFPPQARVFVEAYRQTSWQRFDFGTVRRVASPDNTSLSEFASTDGVKFRVKVVEPSTDGLIGTPAKILGVADHIPPIEFGESNARSLLPLVRGDSRDEVWKLVFDETGPPILEISSALEPEWNNIRSDPAFATMVLPSVFCSILTRIILIERHTDMDDEENWMTQWLQMAVNLPGMEVPPPDEESGNQQEWIEEAVSALCRWVENGKKYKKWRQESE